MDTPLPQLKMLVCSGCQRSATKCICTFNTPREDGADRKARDRLKITDVFTGDQVRAAVEAALDDSELPAHLHRRVIADVLANLQPDEQPSGRRVRRRRPLSGSRAAVGGKRLA